MLPRWALWTSLTMLTWGVWAVLTRLIENKLTPAYTQALSTVGLVPVLAIIYCMREPEAKGSRRLGVLLALASGVVSSIGNVFYYRLLNEAAAATAVPLTAQAPLVTVLLAIPILGERINRVQVAGVVLSVLAIYLFNVQQEQGPASWSLVWALAPIVLWGLTGLLQKMSTDFISARQSALCFLLAFLPVSAWILVTAPRPSTITTTEWIVAAAVGFTLALGNLTVLLAYASKGKASIIAPLAGLYPIVSVPIAFVALDETVSWRQGLGILAALLAVVALSYESGAGPPLPQGADRAASS